MKYKLFWTIGGVMIMGMVGCLFINLPQSEERVQTRTIRELSGTWEYTDPDGSKVEVTVPHCWNIEDALVSLSMPVFGN